MGRNGCLSLKHAHTTTIAITLESLARKTYDLNRGVAFLLRQGEMSVASLGLLLLALSNLGQNI